MSERVLEVILGRVPTWTPGTVSGYKKVALGNNRCYPGALTDGKGTLCGRVLQDIKPDELARLDRFEGEEYAPVVVTNVTLEGGKSVSARLWVLADLNGVLDSEWSYDKFLKENEEWYVRMCAEWADDDSKEQQQCTSQRRGGD